MQNNYGQVPIPPQNGRRQDMYGQPPPPHHMRPHPGYQHYYTQQMPHIPPYQHYPQPWYPPAMYQPHYPQYQPRPQYYPPPMPSPPQMPLQHGPLIVSSQPPMPHTPRAFAHPPLPLPPVQQNQAALHSAAPSMPPLDAKMNTPPSRPVSTISSAQAVQDGSLSAVSASPAQAPSEIHAELSQPREPFSPPIPWQSNGTDPFPPRAPRQRYIILRSQQNHEPLVFPPEDRVSSFREETTVENSSTSAISSEKKAEIVPYTPTETSITQVSHQSSDNFSSQPTTPSSMAPTSSESNQKTPTQQKSARVTGPVIPVVPILPMSPVAARRSHRDSVVSNTTRSETENPLAGPGSVSSEPVTEDKAVLAPIPVVPKSWADLVRKQAAANGSAAATAVAPVINGFSVVNNESLGDVLGGINVTEEPSKIAFLQPRGLVNTGNMCYMNSVLQVLVFCTPFYSFLDKIAQKAAHTFKSSTPLVDAMIMFMREYPTIDSATSVEKLKLRLKPDDFEKYGDNLRPDFVYDTINKLPRFRDMRRGHQQDAQEFLGFLLEELHEECSLAITKANSTDGSGRSTPVPSNANENVDDQTEWLEVGKRQKPSVTRTSGTNNTDSPITNIFGGKLRSEFKIPGDKTSITFEPYQPLQLDIGSPEVNNIIDALKAMTKPESMQGSFKSARGTTATATKQVFIETLPPVLILHLKRFHYDSATKRAEKIWKKVGYPLELELPKEVFPANTRSKFAAHGGLPRYRLTGVIYHHGKNANGGHYTVDIRRQDGKEWIRLDDTFIRRIRSEDVAEGGSEEDPKVLAAALERHKKQAAQGNNRFQNIEADLDEGEESANVWSQVNGHSRSKSTMSTIVNGNATPAKDTSGPQTPRYKESVKDNKVAYLLFYQRIST